MVIRRLFFALENDVTRGNGEGFGSVVELREQEEEALSTVGVVFRDEGALSERDDVHARFGFSGRRSFSLVRR